MYSVILRLFPSTVVDDKLFFFKCKLQLAFHKNNDKMNSLWKGLGYFSSKSYPERLGSAFRMLQEKKSSDEIFNRNFVSAEGWYSQHVFKANISTKIAGRGFDDFYRHPVVLYQGRLSRCGLGGNLTGCIQEATQLSEPVGVQTMPVMQVSTCLLMIMPYR